MQAVLKRLKKICLALLDTNETFTWGSPHFRVGEKIFANFGTPVIGFKLEKAHQQAQRLLN